MQHPLDKNTGNYKVTCSINFPFKLIEAINYELVKPQIRIVAVKIA